MADHDILNYIPRHIYAVRHGQRADNVNKVWYLNSPFAKDNPPLSERGVTQAMELYEKFKGTHFDYVFSSPYERCVGTASIITRGRNELINIEPGFLESAFLCKERVPGFETAIELSRRYNGRINTIYNQPMYRGWSASEYELGVNGCKQRVKHTLERVLKNCHGDLLIVAHKHSLAAIHEFFCEESTYPGHATVTKYVENFDLPNFFQPDYVRDSSHLSDQTDLDAKPNKNHNSSFY